MNTGRLLEHYERISDAPDAIARLRRFILDLAARGKIVQQDPNDEPASTLLKRIHGERAYKRNFAQIDEQELEKPLPELPRNWCWTTVDQISNDSENAITDGPFGSQLKSSHYIDTPGCRVIRLQNIGNGVFREQHRSYIDSAHFDRLSKHHVQGGDLVVAGLVDPSVRCCQVPLNLGPALVKADCYRFSVHSRVCAAFVSNFLNSTLAQEFAAIHHHGMTLTRIGLGNFRRIPVPLPPFAEQHRIVAKVVELMTLCDRLEATRGRRETLRDRLATASLARLNAPDPETFQADVRLALGLLPAITTRSNQIKQLRQTILSLAVRGKLVAQDANEEAAPELLKRIAKEFGRLVGEGKLNKPKPVKPVKESDYSAPTPNGWSVARFNQIAAIQSNLVDPKRFKDMPHIAPDNIESWTARLLPYVSIGEAGVLSGKHLFSGGAILYSKIRPNLAKVTKVDFDGLCSADMYPIQPLIDRDFLVIFMITKDFVDQAVSEDNRVAMPKINQSALSDILVPVPPFAEQHRIVAKIDELMTLCDRLEASLTAAVATRCHLLDALLAEALAPVDTREMEAAE
jgi:type I restriction enzyme S subunit